MDTIRIEPHKTYVCIWSDDGMCGGTVPLSALDELAALLPSQHTVALLRGLIVSIYSDSHPQEHAAVVKNLPRLTQA